MVDEIMLQEIKSSEMNRIRGIAVGDCFALFASENAAVLIDHERKSYFENKDVVMVGFAGLNGGIIIASEKKEELQKRYAASFIEQAIDQKELLREIPEAATAGLSDECCMIILSEGGVFAGLWKMSAWAGVGLEIYSKKIPVKQETIEISNFYEINPYILNAEGCALLFTDNGQRLVQYFEKYDIPSEVIGITTSENDRIVTNGVERSFLVKRYKDPLYEVLPEKNPKKKKRAKQES